MSLEAFNGFINIQFAHMNALIGGATCKRGVRLPVYIQRRSTVKTELLSTLPTCSVPNNRCFINPSAENIVATFIPL